MTHLESAFTGKNNLWRYLVMIAAVFIAINSIGAIPLFIGLAIKSVSDPGAVADLASNPNDLSILGFDPNLSLLMLTFPFLAGFAAFLILVKPLHGRSFPVTINGTSRIRWNRIMISALVWIILSAAYMFIYIGVDSSNFRLNNITVTLAYLVIISLLMIPFQASLEEIIFRGYLFQGFAVVFRNGWMPLIVTSVIFGLMHAWNPEIKEFGFWTMMPQYILFGLLFGITTIMDDGIEIAIGAHTANNVFISIMLTHKSSVIQTPALYEQLTIKPWTEFLALLLTSAVFLIAMKIIFRWGKAGKLLAGNITVPAGDQTG